MRHPMKVLIPTLAASLLLSACGSSSPGKSASSASEARSAASQSSGAGSSALVRTASNPKLGATVLVDARGLTLYHLSAEQNGKFICTSTECLQVWHPLPASAGSTPSGSVGSLGSVTRPDGTGQVTYKGMPLYTFAQDKQAGDANGQGIRDVGTWSAVTTATTARPPAASGGGEKESSGGGGRYGY
jgi:predicted lipoprotein with Yx(FWY)xxD motif